MNPYRLIISTTITFSMFIAWIIYLADTRQHCIFFDLVRRMPYGDKIGHAVLFGVLSLGATLALKLKGLNLGRGIVPYGALLIFTIALGEELSQYFIPGRTIDIADLTADLCGITICARMAYSAPFRGLVCNQ